MRRYLMLLLGAVGVIAAQNQTDAVVIDGALNDRLWSQIAPGRLTPTQAGVPNELGGEVSAMLSGRYLYVAARLPEPGGRLTARSIGKNPHWEEEDSVTFVVRVASENDWMIQVGPLGAYSVKWRRTGESDWYTSRPEKCDGFLVAAQTGEREWRVEAAIPVSQLGSPRKGALYINAERTRAQRAGIPEERWRWPGDQHMVEVPGSPSLDSQIPDPVFHPPLVGNSEPPIEVGYRHSVPPLETEWNDDDWRDISVWTLYRNEPGSRAPVFPTEIKMMHDRHTLALMARCAEPYGTVAEVKERDGEIHRDDSFQVYIATSGSSYVQYAVNPLGYVLDANGFSGGPRVSSPHVEWNSPVRATAKSLRGEWIARLDVPLDFVSSALGEATTPRDWRILLVRHRPGRDGEPPETSVLPITQSVTPFCPARYRRLALVDKEPSQVHGLQVPAPSGNLAFAPTRVLSAEQRKPMALSDMLDRNIKDRTLKILQAEKRDWERVQTLDDWKSFRDPKWKALAASMGEFPPHRPLEMRVTKEFQGDGYRRQDLVYQTQPGFWVTANLYLPIKSGQPMPGIVIAHSQHGPKTQFELQDMGMLWARVGCAVLVIDLIGHGERLEGYPWDREGYNSRYITGMQLYLIGESLIKWIAWDIIRGIDLLLERKDVDENRIILLGSVAGGGDPAAVVAALDQRVSTVVPFNFGESTPEVPRFIPERNQWPLDLADPGLSDWETTRCLRRGIIDQFLQWTICAMAAPRRFVYSYELGWNVEDLPAWARYKKVYELYHAGDHLANAHGFGPYPGPGECWNIGPAQRRSLYPTLQRWFGIPIPFEGITTSIHATLAKEAGERRPEAELAVLNPSVASKLHMRPVHELARDIGRGKVESARSALAGLAPPARRDWLRAALTRKLGDIEANRDPQATIHWSKKLPDSVVEGITITVEPGITVPILLFRPVTRGSTPLPVVVGVAKGGKEAFLASRSNDLEAMLKNGVAICLPDVRGTGETSPDVENDETTQAINEEMLGETLVGRRLKDLRTVLAYLEQRQDLDAKRIALWGASLVPSNGTEQLLDELPLWQVGPQIQQQAQPLGGLLAVLGALFGHNVCAIVVHGGLGSYASILDDAFTYVPSDITVPGILESGDLADIEASLSPVPILLEDLVDAKNRVIPARDLRRGFMCLYDAYRELPASLSVRSGQPSHVAEWLLAHLKKQGPVSQ